MTARVAELCAKKKAGDVRTGAELRHEMDLIALDTAALKSENKARLREILPLRFERAATPEAAASYLPAAHRPGS